MDDVYQNIEEYNPNKKRKTLTVFDDMIADMLSNKRLNPIKTELFIGGRNLNISLVFITLLINISLVFIALMICLSHCSLLIGLVIKNLIQ